MPRIDVLIIDDVPSILGRLLYLHGKKEIAPIILVVEDEQPKQLETITLFLTHQLVPDLPKVVLEPTKQKTLTRFHVRSNAHINQTIKRSARKTKKPFKARRKI